LKRHAFVTSLLAIVVIVACERSVPADNSAAADSAGDSAAAVAADSGTTASPKEMPGALFKPSEVKKGDKIASLEVASNKTQAAPASRLGVTGSVSFEGEVQLSGSYRAHFDYPDVKEGCFWVDPSDWPKLPRVSGDDRIKWFCFANKDDALGQLGALGTETRATIVIEDYTTNLAPSDVWDTARLVRVVNRSKLP
jgi:hypothetical protein